MDLDGNGIVEWDEFRTYVTNLQRLAASGIVQTSTDTIDQQDPVLSLVPIQVASGPAATPVHFVSAPPAQVPTLCRSHAALLSGEDILLQATFVVAGVQVKN